MAESMEEKNEILLNETEQIEKETEDNIEEMGKGTKESAWKNGKVKKLESEIEKLKEEIEELTDARAEYEDAFRRKAADFDNYKKRMLKEMENYRIMANRELILEVLPIVDNFDRAMRSSEGAKDFNALLEGIKLTHSQFHKLFEDFKVTPIESVDKEFDPNLHEALLMEERDDVEYSNTVTEEFEKGYMMGDFVLRHSKVKVAKKKG